MKKRFKIYILDIKIPEIAGRTIRELGEAGWSCSAISNRDGYIFLGFVKNE